MIADSQSIRSSAAEGAPPSADTTPLALHVGRPRQTPLAGRQVRLYMRSCRSPLKRLSSPTTWPSSWATTVTKSIRPVVGLPNIAQPTAAPAVGGRIDGELVAVEHGRPDVVAGQVDDVGRGGLHAGKVSGKAGQQRRPIRLWAAAASAAIELAPCVSGTTSMFGLGPDGQLRPDLGHRRRDGVFGIFLVGVRADDAIRGARLRNPPRPMWCRRPSR